MGVSGCGKSTLDGRLPNGWGGSSWKATHCTPPNIARMAAGIPLDDADRVPFLRNVAQRIATGPAQLVITCSALKRSYREQLAKAGPRVMFVHPGPSPELLRQRLRQRSDHFMPALLLDSQLATLEPPGADEPVVAVDGDEPTQRQVEATLAALGAAGFL